MKRIQTGGHWRPSPLVVACVVLTTGGCARSFLPSLGSPFSAGSSVAQERPAVQNVAYEEDAREADPLPSPGESVPSGPQADEGVSLADFAPDKVADTVKEIAGYGPDRKLAEAAFAEGERIFRTAAEAAAEARAIADDAETVKDPEQARKMKKAIAEKERMSRELFAAAAQEFATAAARWPDSLQEEDALMMQAECYYFGDRYPKAVETYDKLIKKYRNTRHMDTVALRRFTLARWWIRKSRDDDWKFVPNFTDPMRPWFDTYGSAVKLFDQIRLDDPTSQLADDAAFAAAKSYFAKQDYYRADLFLDDLRRSFPDSEHQFDVHMLSLKTKRLLYQGPDYDAAPLDAAEKLLQIIVKQFPQQAQEEREYLQAAYQDIRAKQAERVWFTAQFFEGREQYGGARHYYQRIIQQFPTSNLADKARARLAALEGKPDKPPQQAKWLVDAIPKPQRRNRPWLTGDLWEYIYR